MSRASKSSSPNGKRRPWIRWALIAIALFVLYQVLAGPRGLLKLAELRSQRSGIAQQVDSLEARKAELLREKQRLMTDTLYLEKLARKELGMARPGERVYRFVAPSGASGSSGSPASNP
jgi:cell division protein FtsB